MVEQDETAIWAAAIPLDRDQARALLRTIDYRASAAKLAEAQRLVAARDATIAVLRLDPPAVRAPRTRGALSAFLWPARSASAFDAALLDQLAGSGLFLSGWYGDRHGAAIDGDDPWTHYLAAGLATGLAPNPFFDPDWYVETHLGGRRDEPAILHYLRIGRHYALAPGPLFDAAAYLAADPALAAESDALAHFLVHGIDQGRAAIPVGL